MSSTPSLGAPLDEVVSDPALYPFQVDWLRRQALIAKVDDGFFERAAFLDQRALTHAPPSRWVALDELEARIGISAQGGNGGLGLVFHVGHCGSTLISRLLGAAQAVQSLREPLPMRDLALRWSARDMPWSVEAPARVRADAGVLRALWRRIKPPQALSVVKATSFCGVVSCDWLHWHQDDRALFVSVRPEIYLASMLADDRNELDIRLSIPQRLMSVVQRLDAPPEPYYALSPGAKAALAYACEAVNYADALDAHPDRAAVLDFDDYLADPPARLRALFGFYGVDVDAAEVERILASNVPRRYSKDVAHAYGPGDRARRLRETSRRRGEDIQAGLSWLDEFATSNALVGAALDRLAKA